AIACTSSTALAQSADALIDKLVDKGILSVKEANDLREESDKGFTTALSSKNGMPEWVTALKFNGDFRGRYESFNYENGAVGRDRFRYRARFGFTAAIRDQLEVGLRLGSGDLDGGVPTGGIDPISNNQTLQNNASKKGIFLDLAYAKWSPLNTPDWSGVLTVGKMENPFVFPSTMMFDKDYTPEGGAVELTYRLNPEHTLKFTGGGFVLDELSGDSNDPFLAGAQLRLDSAWSSHWSSSLGVSYFGITASGNLGNGAVPNINSGNTRTAGGALVYDYTPLQADASLTYTMDKFPLYPAACPITAFGEYIQNTSASANDVGYAFGVTIGKSGKKGLWDLSYQYRNLEADAVYEEFTESDFGGNYLTAPAGGNTGYRSGTNVRGHIIKAQYSPYDSLTLGITYWITDLINESPAGSQSGAGRLQVDAAIKF
ncbi:MAG: hypothetical protein RLY20_88, partial [Verrucomicrobiota bacterium]